MLSVAVVYFVRVVFCGVGICFDVLWCMCVRICIVICEHVRLVL